MQQRLADRYFPVLLKSVLSAKRLSNRPQNLPRGEGRRSPRLVASVDWAGAVKMVCGAHDPRSASRQNEHPTVRNTVSSHQAIRPGAAWLNRQQKRPPAAQRMQPHEVTALLLCIASQVHTGRSGGARRRTVIPRTRPKSPSSAATPTRSGWEPCRAGTDARPALILDVAVGDQVVIAQAAISDREGGGVAVEGGRQQHVPVRVGVVGGGTIFNIASRWAGGGG